jgi:hypothetical protein
MLGNPAPHVFLEADVMPAQSISKDINVASGHYRLRLKKKLVAGLNFFPDTLISSLTLPIFQG